MLQTGETTENSHIGTGAAPLKTAARSAAQLKRIYPNTRSVGNKQEQLEASVRQENCHLLAIVETCWADSHNWSAALDGWSLLGMERRGEEEGLTV